MWFRLNPAWLWTISRQHVTIIIYLEVLASKDWVITLNTHRSCKPAVQIKYHNGYMWDIMIRPVVNRQGILWFTYVQDKTTFGWLPALLLTLSRQGICCLNSVQDLQSYDLHKWLSSSPSSKIEIGVSKGLSILDFLKGYKPPGCTNSGLQWRRIKSPSAKSRRVFKLRIDLSTDEVFKVALAQWLLFYQWIWFILQWKE